MNPAWRSVRRHLPRLIGLALFAWIIARSDMGKILAGIRAVRLPVFAAAVLLFVFIAWIKSVRWRHLLLSGTGIRMTAPRAFQYYMAAVFLGACTPGRLGELRKISYATRSGASVGRAVAATLLDRALDLALLIALGYFAILYHFGLSSPHATAALGFVLGGCIALAAAVAFRRRLFALLERAAKSLLSETHAEHLGRETKEFANVLLGYGVSTWAISTALTAIACVGYYLHRYTITQAAGIDAGFVYISIAMTAIALLVLLPVSILNIGTRDAALIFLLAKVGVSAEQAVSCSSLILLAILINTLVSSLFFLSLKRS